jgi:hypothetical protein
MAKEKCVMCGCTTDYDFERHIDYRYGYVEGVGQLCKSCYDYKPKLQEITDDNSENGNIYDNNKT